MQASEPVKDAYRVDSTLYASTPKCELLRLIVTAVSKTIFIGRCEPWR